MTGCRGRDIYRKVNKAQAEHFVPRPYCYLTSYGLLVHASFQGIRECAYQILAKQPGPRKIYRDGVKSVRAAATLLSDYVFTNRRAWTKHYGRTPTVGN